ncbi:MAG: hypothetical protein HYY37_04530 [Candidatus Aenigmarchaeota archaeon]|nr:hypothetical protein [Candidatus Aenigmarchaeota archaeon]
MGIVFVFLWIDKVIFGILRINSIVEFTTVSTIIIGIVYGPIFGFFFSLFLIPLLDGIKIFFIKVNIEWPPFIPGFANVIDGLVAVAAWFLMGFDLLYIMLACLALKYTLNFLFHVIKLRVYTQQPFDYKMFFSVISNVAIIVLFRDIIMGIITSSL